MSDYKRLTHKNGNRIEEYCEVGHCKYADFRVCKLKGIEHNVDEDCIPAMIERLAELEDKIEQGTLIEVPCKVGDTVYWVWEEYTNGKQKLFIEEWEVEKICIEKNEWAVKGLGEELVEGVRQFFWCHSSKFGTWWFLTREEAEKRLKELQNEHKL